MHSKTVSFLLLAGTFIFCLAVMFVFLPGGLDLGFLLTILVAEGTFCVWLWLPQSRASIPGRTPEAATIPEAPRPRPWLMIFLAVAILDLSFCYYLYDHLVLKLIGFPLILGLLAVQYLYAAQVFRLDWDRPGFWCEVILSILVRPFDGLGGFGRTVAGLFARRKAEGQGDGQARTYSIFAKVLLGVLLAVPVLLFSGVLLASADPVFANLFRVLREWMAGWFARDVVVRLLLALLILPFAFSFLYSGRNRPPLAAQAKDDKATTFQVDQTVLATFLFAVNALYLVFAIVQLTYLTGAFSARLPADLTYAEYARSGFFELSFVSLINLGLTILAVKAADRQATRGRVVRIACLLLVLFSLVQWGSALFRMRMYVQAYGLSRLRFFVTAFMLLMLVFFAAILVKEFRKSFPFFKTCAIAAVLALMLLNHVNSDAWIARHNIRRYTAGAQLDQTYLASLSADAVPTLLAWVDEMDPAARQHLSEHLIDRHQNLLAAAGEAGWQQANVSRARARKQLSARISELQAWSRPGR